MSSSSNYKLNNSGGNSTVTLTTNELPAHNHRAPQVNNGKNDYVFEISRQNGLSCTARYQVATSTTSKVYTNGTKTTESDSVGGLDDLQATGISEYTQSTGSGKPFNIMPSYLVVNTWKRIS